MASGATCVQRLDGSRDSAIHTKYRISLRSSSMQEPRYPLPRVVQLQERLQTPTPPENGQGRALFVRFFLGAFCAGVRCLTSRRTRCPKVPCASARKGNKWKARQPGHDPRIVPREYRRVRGFSAWQVFDNDPSAGSPTETLLRLLLPLNDKVQWTSRDVAGSEPPTSPRSEHFTGPFNR
jgi:hypothetical protein